MFINKFLHGEKKCLIIIISYNISCGSKYLTQVAKD